MSKDGEEVINYTIVVGNPLDGIRLVGIFNEHEDAIKYAQENFKGDDWWVEHIGKADNGKEGV